MDYLGFYQRYRGLDFTALALGNVYGPRQDPHGEAGRDRDLRLEDAGGRAGHDLRRREPDARLRVHRRRRARASSQAIERGSGKLVNIGTGLETSVNGLYRLLADIIGFDGEPEFGPAAAGRAAPDRARHRLAPSAIAWKPWTHLEDGLGRDRRVPQGRVNSRRSFLSRTSLPSQNFGDDVE